MESAIPARLKCPRTRTQRAEDSYAPPYPAFVARSNAVLTRVVMLYLGVQYGEEALAPAARAAAATIGGFLAKDARPVHLETAGYTDSHGFTTIVTIAYWTETTAVDAWWRGSGIDEWWTSDDRLRDGVGYFKEIAKPAFENFETLFSAANHLEGIGTAMGGWSESDIQEHGYWGSMRDRLPSSQTDALEPNGTLGAEAIEPSGRRVRMNGHDNVALIKSGQDWSATTGRERTLYTERMEPTLREGMDFLETSGVPVGCYVSRYMNVLDEAGQPVTKSFGLSYWRSLAHMERWAEAHPTHLAIFGGFMGIVQELNFDVKLELYHEVSVLRAEDQEFEYVNCHPRTGLLNASNAAA